MNEEIILNIAKPYVKDSAITYDEFDQLFSILSRKEQYAVCDVLFNNGINLVDSNVAEDALVLDIDAENNLAEDFSADDFEIHYDEDPFRDIRTLTEPFNRCVTYVTHTIAQRLSDCHDKIKQKSLILF